MSELGFRVCGLGSSDLVPGSKFSIQFLFGSGSVFIVPGPGLFLE